jgi:hypothetical protein
LKSELQNQGKSELQNKGKSEPQNKGKSEPQNKGKSEPQNIEYRISNVEVWNRCALSNRNS